jgi:hypothetical protein
MFLIIKGKAWVFHYITQSISPQIFDNIIVKRNHLGLTDEDPSEYMTFEGNSQTDNNYCQTKIMFRTFHAIWKPLKRISIHGFLRIMEGSYYLL